MSGYEDFTCFHVSNCCRGCSKNMCTVTLIILVLGRPSSSATMSSYEGVQFVSTVIADGLKRFAQLHCWCSGGRLTRQQCRAMRALSVACTQPLSLMAQKDASRYTDNVKDMHVHIYR